MTGTKVFLCWSGERSKTVAQALRDWLPVVLQAVEPWMSESDIEKGSRWRADVASQLQDSKIGVICLTPENLRAPWVNFEAGALSKTLSESRACTYLLDLTPGDVIEPLSQFQATRAEKEDTKKLIQTINSTLDKPISGQPLDTIFEKFWPDLDRTLKSIPSNPKATREAKRSLDAMIEDVLVEVRELSKRQTALEEITRRGLFEARRRLYERRPAGVRSIAEMFRTPTELPDVPLADAIKYIEEALRIKKEATEGGSPKNLKSEGPDELP